MIVARTTSSSTSVKPDEWASFPRAADMRACCQKFEYVVNLRKGATSQIAGVEVCLISSIIPAILRMESPPIGLPSPKFHRAALVIAYRTVNQRHIHATVMRHGFRVVIRR